MIKTKQIKLGSNYCYIVGFIFFTFIYKGCITHESSKESNEQQTVYESNEWIRGKRLFLDNCAFCHIVFSKDEIFNDFNCNVNRKENIDVIDSLVAILSDSIHNQIIGVDTLSVNQLKDICLYIKIPRKSGTID